jgi:hypothetical protein
LWDAIEGIIVKKRVITSPNSTNIDALVAFLAKLGVACLELLFEKLEWFVVLIYVDRKWSDIRDLLDFDDFI